MRKTNKKPVYNFVIAPDFTEKEIRKMSKFAETGHLNAKLDLIMHNQRVIYYKLHSK